MTLAFKKGIINNNVFLLCFFHNNYRVIILKEKNKKEQSSVEKDYYSSVLLCQILCCALTLIIFFAFKSGSHWTHLRQIYALLLEDDFLTQEVDMVMADLSSYIIDGDTAYAVSGSTVEPYDAAEFSQEDTASSSVAEPVFNNVAEIACKPEKLKADYADLVRNDEPKIVFPVEGGRYTSYFGERTDPISEGSDYHNGVDIGADEGDRIRAVYDGKVTEVGEDSSSGNYLFISHGNGYETFYCHCSEILVDEDTVIRKGETVALVGSTGYSTGPHLHFEVRLDGESIDPLPLLDNAV